ncbi:MAG: hypothetical protein EU529_13260 [Promethearchaeota archaeon]|nr:MAG: hypothetical protein EU529_13260 [Candidatus Lokiarchaeota archaeon]
MSIRFKKFLLRAGKESEFKPLKNALLNYLRKDAENKYKNYPRLLELMKAYWKNYEHRFMIANLLKDHYEEIFYFYLTTIFPFRKGGLSLEDPEAPTTVDFKCVYRYHYNQKEIAVVEEVMKELNIQDKVEGILKRVLIFAVSSFAPMVEQIFTRPFAFQFANIDSKQFDNGEYEVIATISAREQ